MSIEIERAIPTGNAAWPLAVKVNERGVTIYHDTQRDSDRVQLSLEEWAKVVELVPRMLSAIEGAAKAISIEMNDAVPAEVPQ